MIFVSIVMGIAWWLIMLGYLKNRREKNGVCITLKEQVIKKSSIFYMICILFVAIVGIQAFHFYGYGVFKIMRYMILMEVMILLAIIDAQEYVIPNKILLILLGIRMFLLIGECIQIIEFRMVKELFASAILGMILGGGLFLFFHFLTKQGMGMGDVKLFGVIGFYVGVSVLWPIMLLSTLLSALYGVGMLALHKLGMKDALPFAPFVAVGVTITLILGF